MGKMDKIFEMFKSVGNKENILGIDEASRVFNELSDNKTVAEIEQKLMSGDFSVDIKAEIIDKTVNIITTQIKQMKLKNELESITLKVGENEYPFPPSVSISCVGKVIELYSEFVKPKELHYEIDAISADYNLTYSNNSTIIKDTYQEIIIKLQHYDWGSICIVSKGLEVNYAN